MEISKNKNSIENIENNEAIEAKSKIISLDDLLEIIYQGQSLPQDKRFFPIKEGGVFKYLELKDLINVQSRISKKIYPVIEMKNKIIGLSELEQNPDDESNYWFKFISVDPEYQNKGYASMLIEKIFEFAKKNNYSLTLSRYSEEGLQKLKNTVEKLIQETGVEIVGRIK